MTIELKTQTYVNAQAPRDEIKNLHCHFDLFYRLLAEAKSVPEAAFETTNTATRCISGMQTPFNNAIRGCPKQESNWDSQIREQLDYFQKANMPFVWYLDEGESQKFKDKLVEYGFKDAGILKGVIGYLKVPFKDHDVPEGCTLEMVKDEESMNGFTDLVCSTFGFEGKTRERFKAIHWNASRAEHPKIYHWVAKRENKVISTVSTLIEGNSVSFWNGATLPEFRKQGMSTALRKLSLNHAISNGCKIGMSFLMAEGMALGICSRLGYEPKWRFHAFIAPSKLVL